ncbi:transposase [Sphingomonas turrisvirgatae]|uniref:Insertion element IS402-like domain-containing protein n=1 Tax=Sphingomonas turrisvirgatae TaxID=1888892 RepID=A0A1E3LSR1_9SPHN|nr:transposase [Sphingomonas turrisvirgatae]ODP36195.1 hypothetical protein BFL28_07240 [Sphingomonas turrisvirgatae]
MEAQQITQRDQIEAARALIEELQSSARTPAVLSTGDRVAFRYGRSDAARTMQGTIAGRGRSTSGEIVAIQVECDDGLPAIVRVRPAAITGNPEAAARSATAASSRAAARELADELVAQAARGNIRAVTPREKAAAAARKRFDASNVPPSSGPVAGALAKSAARRSEAAARRAECEKMGRFYVEPHYCRKARAQRWRVQDRYTGEIALFALDGLKVPARLAGYRKPADAIAHVRWLDSYFHRLGCGIGPLPGALSDAQLVSAVPAIVSETVPACVWQAVAAFIPAEPAQKRSTKARQVCNRAALAGLLIYLKGKGGWHSIPTEIGCSAMLVRKRFTEWRAAGVLPAIQRAIQAHPHAPAGLHWEKLGGLPTIAPEERAALIRRIEHFRLTQMMTVGEASKALFGHGSAYPRILGGGAVLVRTAERAFAGLHSYRAA